jgi:response regulator RpfG family c-di-GMP phosphodiesterase
MKKARIMIAQDAKALGKTKDALDAYELVVVTDLMQARYQLIEDGIDVFVIGIHFDESRAIDLVNFIRNDKKHERTPIIFVRLLPTTMKDILKTTVVALIKIGTISDYLELEGDPDFASKIKQSVSSLVPGKKSNEGFAQRKHSDAECARGL